MLVAARRARLSGKQKTVEKFLPAFVFWSHKKASGIGPTPDPASLADIYWRFRADQYTGSGSSLSWTELISGVYNAVQQGASPTPTPIADGGLDFNNQPVMRFDRATATALQMAADFKVLDKDTGNTVIAVLKQRSATPSSNFDVYLSLGTIVSAAYTCWCFSNFATYRKFFTGGGSASADTNTGDDSFDSTTTAFAVIDRFGGGGSFTAGADHTVAKAGAAITMSDALGAVNTSFAFNTIGCYGASGLNADVDIAEILVYKRSLTNTELSTVIYPYLYATYNMLPATALSAKGTAAKNHWSAGILKPMPANPMAGTPAYYRWDLIGAIAAAAAGAAAILGGLV
jgi:hypothetical protein